MTFDEIYNMAIDKGVMDQELKVKDAAYSCICGIIEDVGLDELLENSECKEDSVISFCEKTEALFDERGNENIIWRRRQDEYLKEDILTIAEDIGVSVDTAYMQKVIEKYHKIEDSNVPYNDTVEIAILSVMKEEK